IDSERLLAAAIAVGDRHGLGTLEVRYLTKGGAYNLFRPKGAEKADAPESVKAVAGSSAGRYQQLIFASSIDELVLKQGLPSPTHIKIDVDGNEPSIIAGCHELLKQKSLRSLLIEINKRSSADLAIIDVMHAHGFKIVSDTSVWDSKK